ncbi:MAG: 50S ribosomal protein L25/general stress protein Ctc [Candidatus Omnitrophica bacterium]|nr:50S ribosomal protein L25/general stress protein Ctc [Candidatus Omnitrophota bacterium]
MPEKYKLKTEERSTIGSAEARRLRRGGFIPAVVYGKKEASVHLKVPRSDLERALRTGLGGNVIIDLEIRGGVKAHSKTVLVREVQQDPVTGVIQHVDFDHISLTQRIKIKVPVAVKGEAVGVVQDGGILERILWELEVECLPADIPERIEVDCSLLKMGEAIHVKDLVLASSLKVLNEPDAVVVTVVHPEKEPEPVAVEGAETQEPEVITKGKKEEVPEGTPAAEKPPASAKEKAAPEKTEEKGKGEGHRGPG